MLKHKGPEKTHSYEERSTKIAEMLQGSEFSLVLRVDELHAELDKFGELRKNGGFCYGYAEYWKFHLLTRDPDTVRALFPTNLPLLDDIIKLQHSKSAYITKEIKNSGTFDAMIAVIATRYIMKNFVPGRMTEIVIATKPWTNDCHDVRMYCDKQGHMHWFDANAGWFISNNPNPSVDSVIKFLSALFRVLSYHKMTSSCRHTSYIPKPYTAPRRVTFVFDDQVDESKKGNHKQTSIVTATKSKPIATSVEKVEVEVEVEVKDDDYASDSSSDESETEQLLRLAKNMRITL